MSIKKLRNGTSIERTFKSGVTIRAEKPDLEPKEVEYMYEDGDFFHFMDQSNFETISIPFQQIAESKEYLQEGIKLEVLFWSGKAISVDLPNFVEPFLEVTQTDPGLKGDTSMDEKSCYGNRASGECTFVYKRR